MEKNKYKVSGLAGTETEKNLWAAFAEECKAKVQYDFFAKAAKKEGYNEIAQNFTNTANNEVEHGKIWFKLLHDGFVPSTAKNLVTAADTEHWEWTDMYVSYAKKASEEGFNDVAELFMGVSRIEKMHEQRFRYFIEQLQNNEVFESNDSETVWICMNCGHIHIGKVPPEFCPICNHPRSYFKRRQSLLDA